MGKRLRAMDTPYAVVTDLDCMTGLQAARIFAAHGTPVIGIAADRRHPCCRTECCDRILFADTTSEELITALAQLGRQFDRKAVLYPCSDASVLLVSEHRHALEPWYHMMLPDHSVVTLLTDKVRFSSYAQENGFLIPKTMFLRSRKDAEAAVQELKFPCLLKPSFKTPLWQEQTKAKAFKLTTPERFLATYDECTRWADLLIAQEWIEGRDSNLYSCNCYFNANSEPVVTFVARKLRQWPPEVGTSCLGEECRNDFVLAETVRLFRGLAHRGLAYLEMKLEERSGKYFIIEPNVGRPTGRSAIAEVGGVDLLYAVYCDAVGWSLPANLQQKYERVKWVYFRRDLQSAFYYWKRGELTVAEWLRSLRGCRADALFSWSDPAPFFFDMWYAMVQLFRNGASHEGNPA